MNSRDYKSNYVGGYFHVYNRGVNKSAIFLDDQDYQNFLYRARVLLGKTPLPKRTAKGGIRLTVLPKDLVEIITFCLMPNHFHFLLKQNDVDGARMLMHRLCTSYTKYFNKKYHRVGHVFQDVFKLKDITEDAYLTQLTGYIHLNPKNAFTWKYSSLQTYLGKTNDSMVDTELFMKMHNISKNKYKTFLLKHYNPKILDAADLLYEEE